MAIINHPTSVNAGSTLTITWEQLRNYTYSVERQINNASNDWVTVSNIFQNRYSETASNLWSQVRYRVQGLPREPGMIDSGITDWITIIGGAPVDPDPVDPDPILTIPNILVPQTVPPMTRFEVSWSDSNVGATYELEEEINNGNWQSLSTTITSKSYFRTSLAIWNNVRYRVRAKKGSETTAWSYSPMITIKGLFPEMSVKVGNEVRKATDGWVMVNGTLRKITDMWVMVNGTLRKS